MINIIQDGDLYNLSSQYDPAIIDMIHKIPGASWNPAKKIWRFHKNMLGTFLSLVKGTPYEHQVTVYSDEEINTNAALDSTDSIPDIDIADMDIYVQNGSSLYAHQYDFLKWAKARGRRGFVLADDPGCVTGDTRIITRACPGGAPFIVTIEYLLKRKKMFPELPNPTEWCLSYNEKADSFRFNKIISILDRGVKPVYTLNLGTRYIKATADHKFLTDHGYVELQNLSVGDKVFIYDGSRRHKISEVEAIEPAGEEHVYDIVMADPFHNFIANGIVVHNCGKTLETINYALYQRKTYGYKHCLIICCVNVAKHSWCADIKKHTNGEEIGFIVGSRKLKSGKMRYNGSGKDRLKDLKGDGTPLPYFIIINIESLRLEGGAIKKQIIEMINNGEIGMIAIDECHRNMSPKSAQGKAILEIKKKTDDAVQWISITGTPITSKPTDVYTPLKLIDAHTFKNFWEWQRYFCIFGGYDDHDIIAYRNIPMLKEMLQGNMIRRLKTDVLDLPDKIRMTEYVELSDYQAKLYEDIRKDMLEHQNEIVSSMNPLVKFLRLRQACGFPEYIDPTLHVDSKYLLKNTKMQRAIELIDEIIERDEKVVVFSQWVSPLKTLYRFIASRYKTACYTGTMNETDREKHKQAFMNNPEVKVLIGTIGAIGTSSTLVAANNIIFLDEPWTPADRLQAEDRINRIGAVKQSNIYTLIAKDTVDDKVHEILEDKELISNYIVDGKIDIRSNPDLFTQLLGL